MIRSGGGAESRPRPGAEVDFQIGNHTPGSDGPNPVARTPMEAAIMQMLERDTLSADVKAKLQRVLDEMAAVRGDTRH